MDDLVGRLLRELPDTNKDRYDVAYERGRAQARSTWFVGGLALGLAVGGAAMALFDPRLGHGRRVELGQRLGALVTDLSRTLQGRGRDLGNRAFGAATELGLPGTPASNAERREGAAALRPEIRTTPRSAAAPLVSAEPGAVHPEPAGAATSPR